MAMPPRERSEMLNLFQQQMDDLLKLLFGVEGRENPGEHEYVPPLDIYETIDRYIIEIELPGFEKAGISIRLCCNVLVVEGVKRDEDRSAEVTYICLERKFGRFVRVVELPPTVDTSQPQATYVLGLLRITFPRIANVRSMIREIPIE